MLKNSANARKMRRGTFPWRILPAFVQQSWYELQASMPTIKTSLFERLIGDYKWRKSTQNNRKAHAGGGDFESSSHRVPFSVLDEQRRMRCDIADLTRAHYSDVIEICDHPKTATQRLGDHLKLTYEQNKRDTNPALLKQFELFASYQSMWSETAKASIPAVLKSVFFWDINKNKESRPIAGLSACNETEANAIVGLVGWLLRCGTPPSSITIITPYKGQKNLILR